MKINKYINNLKAERKELSDKYKEMQLSTDKNLKTGIDPLFEEKNNIRKRLIETTEKLVFLINLRNAVIDNELKNRRK